MNNIIPFSAGSLPSYLAGAKKRRSALTVGVGVGFPVLSIKGKTWTVVRGRDDRKILTNPKDPDEPATNISVVIIAASENLSRVYYANGYEDGANSKPDCFSNDGKRPDSAAEQPQARSCAACKHSVYGSGNNGRGFACANSRRLAVAPLGALNDPMLLRVPGGSLKNLSIFGSTLEHRGVPDNAVVVKIRFDPAEATPKLLFEPVGFVPDEMYADVEGAATTAVVQQILGLSTGDDGDGGESSTKVHGVTKQDVAEALDVPTVDDALTREPEPVKKAEPEPKPAKKAEPEPKPAKKAEPEPKPAKKAESTLAESLDDLLAGFDD